MASRRLFGSIFVARGQRAETPVTGLLLLLLTWRNHHRRYQ